MKESFRIGLNLLHIVPGQVGGSEEYSVQILKAFSHYESPEIKPMLFVLESFQKAQIQMYL